MNSQRANGSIDAEPLRVSDDSRTIEARKIHTRNGVRLELTAGASGRSIRIDPLGLESLSWQDPGELAARLRTDSDVPPNVHPDEDIEAGNRGEELSLLNEFAEVVVRRVSTGEIDFLEIVAPKLGHEIRLPPSVLAAITEHDMALFSELLETPLGPDDH